jgi:hypothetical protein
MPQRITTSNQQQVSNGSQVTKIVLMQPTAKGSEDSSSTSQYNGYSKGFVTSALFSNALEE